MQKVATVKRLPFVANNQLNQVDAERAPISVGSVAWFTWLHEPSNRAFLFSTPEGRLYVRREQKRNSFYWYAVRKSRGKVRKVYVGKAEELTVERLDYASRLLMGPTNTPARVHLRLLGQPSAERDGQRVEIGAAKATALLAYLALHSGTHAREQVYVLLWPQSSDQAAQKNLRNTLWAIQRTFGPIIATTGNRIGLLEMVEADTQAFEQLARDQFRRSERAGATNTHEVAEAQQAIALYRGLLLDGVRVRDAPEFEIWLATERERFGQMYLRAVQRVVAHQQRRGAWADVLTLATRALAEDPLQETVHQAMIEAYARLGKRVEALRAYDSLHALLQQELGVAPLPETDALRQAIVAGELAAGNSFAAAPGIGDVQPSHSAFVGRDAERGVLAAELRRVLGGNASVVLIEGELGIGKTRLWQQWRAESGVGHQLVELRCLEVTQPLLYAPLITWFNQSPAAQRLFAPESALALEWQTEMRRLIPDLRTRRSDLPALAIATPAAERQRVFEVFTQCMLALQCQPLIIAVDDLHWADAATLDLLDYLIDRLRAYPLLLVATYRSEEAGEGLRQRIVAWERRYGARRLVLGRLSRAEAERFVVNLGGLPQQVGRLYTESAGNPYVLGELFHAPADDVPQTLVALVQARLAQLPEVAQQIAQAAAILEPHAEYMVLRHASGRSEDETLDAIDVLTRKRVFEERDERYAFSHPFVATTIRSGLSSARRNVLHRRAAEALAAAYVGRRVLVAGAISIHYQAAGELLQAARYADIAGEQALAMAAWAEAAAWYEQAYAYDPTPQRQLAIGRAHLWNGDVEAARAAFHAARTAYEEAHERRGEARACLDLASTYLSNNYFDAVAHWAEEALVALEDTEGAATYVWARLLLGITQHSAEQVEILTKANLEAAIRLVQTDRLPEAATHNLLALAKTYLGGDT